METLKPPPETLVSSNFPMNRISANFRTPLNFFKHTKLRTFCASSVDLSNPHQPIRSKSCRKRGLDERLRANVKVSNAELKEKWLDSLTCPLPELGVEEVSNGGSLDWIIGIDPDISGALALLKSDDSGHSAQVFDNPYVQVLVGKRVRKRLDAKSIVQLLQSFDAPLGTTAYIEQSIPFPQDGKQGWWSGGFGYGMWIGVLVASGFNVVPVPSLLWKNYFELSGSRMSKDDSRNAASTLFPSLSSLLTRKKDHGRAEALLIAAYGKRLRIEPDAAAAALEIKTENLEIESDAAALEIKVEDLQIEETDVALETKTELCAALSLT